MKLNLLSLLKSGLLRVVPQTSKGAYSVTFEGELAVAGLDGPPKVAVPEKSSKDSPPAQKSAVSFMARYSSPHVETHDKLKLADGANKPEDSQGVPKPVEAKGKSDNTTVEGVSTIAGATASIVPTQVAKPIIAAAQNVPVEKVAKPMRMETVSNSPAAAPTTIAALSPVERRSERAVDLPKAGNQARTQTEAQTSKVENSTPRVQRHDDRAQVQDPSSQRVVQVGESKRDVKHTTATSHKSNDTSAKFTGVRGPEETTPVSAKSSVSSLDTVRQSSNQSPITAQKQAVPIVDSAAVKSSQLKQHVGAITREPQGVQRPMQKELVTETTPKQQNRVKSDFVNSEQETTPRIEREIVPQKPVVGQMERENRLPNQVVESRRINVQTDRSEVVARVWEGAKERVPQHAATRVVNASQAAVTKAPETAAQVVSGNQMDANKLTESARVPVNNREVFKVKTGTTPEVKMNVADKTQASELPRKPDLPHEHTLAEPRVIVQRDVLRKPATPAETSLVVSNDKVSALPDSIPSVSHEPKRSSIAPNQATAKSAEAMVSKERVTPHETIRESAVTSQAITPKTSVNSQTRSMEAKPVTPEHADKVVAKEKIVTPVSTPLVETPQPKQAEQKTKPIEQARPQVNETPNKQTTSEVFAPAKHSDYGIPKEAVKSATPFDPKTAPVLHSRPLAGEAVSPQPKRAVVEPMKPTTREGVSELPTGNMPAAVIKEIRQEQVVSTQNTVDAQATTTRDAPITFGPGEMKLHETPTVKESLVVERKTGEHAAQPVTEKSPEAAAKREPVITPNQGSKVMPQTEPFLRAQPQVVPFIPTLETRSGSVVTNSFDGSRKEQVKVERMSNDQGERLSERSENSILGKNSELKSVESSNTTRQETNSQSGEREAGNSAARAAMEKGTVNQLTATATAKSSAFTGSAANETLKLALQQALEQSRRRLVEPDELRLTLQFGEMGTLDIDVLRESEKFSIRIAAEPALAAMMEEQRLQLAGWLKEQGFPIQQLEIAERQGGQARREGLASEHASREREGDGSGSSGGGSKGDFGREGSLEQSLPRPAYSGARVWTA